MGDQQDDKQGERPVRSSGSEDERQAALASLSGPGPWDLPKSEWVELEMPDPWLDQPWTPEEEAALRQAAAQMYSESTSSASVLSPASPSNAPNPGVPHRETGTPPMTCAQCGGALGPRWCVVTDRSGEERRLMCSDECCARHLGIG